METYKKQKNIANYQARD